MSWIWCQLCSHPAMWKDSGIYDWSGGLLIAMRDGHLILHYADLDLRHYVVDSRLRIALDDIPWRDTISRVWKLANPPDPIGSILSFPHLDCHLNYNHPRRSRSPWEIYEVTSINDLPPTNTDDIPSLRQTFPHQKSYTFVPWAKNGPPY